MKVYKVCNEDAGVEVLFTSKSAAEKYMKYLDQCYNKDFYNAMSNPTPDIDYPPHYTFYILEDIVYDTPDIEQITAINNGMSMLVNLCDAISMMSSIEDYKEYTNRHIKALRDSSVEPFIVEHFESLCHSYLPIAEDIIRRGMKYSPNYEEDNSSQL